MTNMQVLNIQKGYDGRLKPQIEMSVLQSSLKSEQPSALVHNYSRRKDAG